jgi:hypothetical protein
MRAILATHSRRLAVSKFSSPANMRTAAGVCPVRLMKKLVPTSPKLHAQIRSMPL